MSSAEIVNLLKISFDFAIVFFYRKKGNSSEVYLKIYALFVSGRWEICPKQIRRQIRLPGSVCAGQSWPNLTALSAGWPWSSILVNRLTGSSRLKNRLTRSSFCVKKLTGSSFLVSRLTGSRSQVAGWPNLVAWSAGWPDLAKGWHQIYVIWLTYLRSYVAISFVLITQCCSLNLKPDTKRLTSYEGLA